MQLYNRKSKHRWNKFNSEKLRCDPVILNQNKSGFFHRIQNLCKPQAFDSGAESLNQVMEFDVLSRDLGWWKPRDKTSR